MNRRWLSREILSDRAVRKDTSSCRLIAKRMEYVVDTIVPETIRTLRRALSQEQINHYMTDGFLRFGKILDENQTEQLPAGGMTFHHCQVVHRSSPNISSRPRRAVIMRFIPIGTQSPRLQARERDFFTHPILRMKH
jgi:Phytanoyl-CoA dioxygenase (PhyH)